MVQFEGKGLVCYRGGRTVFRELCFAVNPGDALILTGPNGSGKSSLLRLMAGLLPPFSGSLLWEGENISEEPELHNTRLHYVGHQTAIKPVLTVSENLRFWSDLRSKKEAVPIAIKNALDVFDIGHLENVPGQFLSAGQKQRVNLARILASQAPLWLLDEPTTALDVAAIHELELAIERHRKQGNIVILSTHSDLKLKNAKPLELGQFTVGWEDA